MTNSTLTIGQQIAETTYSQLGGRTFAAMVGVKSRMCTKDGELTIKFKARATNKSNTVVIARNANDTYLVTFWSIRGTSCKVVEQFDEIYADQLRTLFTSCRGLYTSLRG